MSTIASDTLTDRQRRIVACAREWIAEHGEAPSVRELGAAVGLTSSSSVAYHLRRLRERGLAVETRGRRSDRCPPCGQ
ncbi:LexA family protein [Streptomyces sp. NPDC056002]|uniref:LexA family protein n=1 Tax=Streptomyces sp. NPDC056002 TaxID=3345675 RepID=UPI0035DB0502